MTGHDNTGNEPADGSVPCANCKQPTMFVCTLCLEPMCDECAVGYLCKECDRDDA